MKYIYILLILITHLAFSQSTFDKTSYDFGEVDNTTLKYADFFIKNNSKKKIYLLTVQKPKDLKSREFSYISSKNAIEPDSTMILRLSINPQIKGRFKYKIPVFMSDNAIPTIINLSGSLKQIIEETSIDLPCPDFNSNPNTQNPFAFKLTIKVIDKKSRQPIEKANVHLIKDGNPVALWKMNRWGYKKEKATLGLYYFYTTKKGYFANEKSTYVNFKRNFVLIELDQLDKKNIEIDSIISVKDQKIATKQNDLIEEGELITINVEKKLNDEIEKNINQDSIIKNDLLKLSELSKNDFSSKNFKSNNIVFVIDKSGSMKKDGKLDLMKYSLNKLVGILRTDDRIGLVSYADDAEVILESTSGKLKEKINDRITNIRATGTTNGGKGIRTGLKLAKQNFIDKGNNEVIVITDGSFSKDSDDFWKHIEKFRKKGIKLSVVGIKNNIKAKKSMISVAKHGGGNYISINKLSDAQIKLIKQIKLNSFKFQKKTYTPYNKR